MNAFSPPVQYWFRTTFGEPTAPQHAAWPAIQRGEHTLILAPTGSGKTLAAFLWGIDQVGRAELPEMPTLEELASLAGVRILYVSPLKALNNDIERNLRAPLAGIQAAARHLGVRWPALRAAVRTGDTPQSVRAGMVKNPPHILITTPESLYLMLTSPKARNILRTVETVIVDEIHTLCGDKRGAHLALSLERLEHLTGRRVQRIGLSATIKPLAEVAQFLGGYAVTPGEDGPQMAPRPVTVIDTGYKKALELRVITPVADFRSLPGDSIWPSVIPRVLHDILSHRSTLIFTNNRRLAERTADRLNAQIEAERSEEIEPGSTEALAPGGVMRGRGIFAIGASGPIRAHHGSIAREARQQLEEELKAGRLPALVGTSSLELGIDIGAVDLVVHLQSPKSVAQGLQRVGRAGHLVGQTSVGHIYTTFREDLVEAAAIARGMLEGDVEPTYAPQNPLDILAQQIVAMVAGETWSAPALYDLVRQAYPFHALPASAFHAVLAMLSGGYSDAGAPGGSALRARIAWDRINDQLAALPGTRLLAVTGAGAITDSGAYDVYLADGVTRVGQLDEEFVFETRSGDTFLLGSTVWRVLEVTDDRVIVGDAAGAMPRMPFWRGDYPWRPYELGVRIGRFRRDVAARLATTELAQWGELEAWLQNDYALDERSARNLLAYIGRQIEAVGCIATDRTIVVETFQDAIGEQRLVIHSPFGGRINGAWALALTSLLRETLGIDPETQANDDGILFRLPPLPGVDLLALVRSLTADEAHRRILAELPDSALFGAHFRMNASRALLLPKARGAKRTPFWLQRLKARDLLAIVRRLDEFPIVVETYRECLRDVLDMPHLAEVLNGLQRGDIEMVPLAALTPSPIAAELLFNFVSVYMYEWDAPKAERQLQALTLQSDLLDALLHDTQPSALLKSAAVAETAARAQHLAPGFQARSAEELAVQLATLGDLTTAEVRARCAGDADAWLERLAAQGRIGEVRAPTGAGAELRWAPFELVTQYEDAWVHHDAAAQLAVLRRFLRHAGPVTREALTARYAWPAVQTEQALATLRADRTIVEGHFDPDLGEDGPPQVIDRQVLEQIRRRSITLLRQEVQPVPLAACARFLLHWQHLHPAQRLAGSEGVRAVVQQLAGSELPGNVWLRDALPTRVDGFRPALLDTLCQRGEVVWVARGADPQHAAITLFPRGTGGLFLPPTPHDSLSATAQAVYAFLKEEGASFVADVQAGLSQPASAVHHALLELALAGAVTNDTLAGLETVLHSTADSPQKRAPLSSLEADLAARRGPTPSTLGRRPPPQQLRAARQRVSARLQKEETAATWPGRWSIVARSAVLGPALRDEARAEALALHLLGRSGVVTRDMAGGEGLWGVAYPALQRLELRGAVRRGYFVAGLAGIQYALPETVEQLRAANAGMDDTLVVVNATDPVLAWLGELAPGALRWARVPSTSVVWWRGQAALLAADNGERVTTAPDVPAEIVRRALEAYLQRPNAPHWLLITTWNGVPTLGSGIQGLLQDLGFQRTPHGLAWTAPPRSA